MLRNLNWLGIVYYSTLFLVLIIVMCSQVAGGFNTIRNEGQEQITEQQYRNQSLQYLEDIRNAVAP